MRGKAMNGPGEPGSQELTVQEVSKLRSHQAGAVSTPDVGVHWELQQKATERLLEGSGI